jgi:hypothetical protein
MHNTSSESMTMVIPVSFVENKLPKASVCVPVGNIELSFGNSEETRCQICLRQISSRISALPSDQIIGFPCHQSSSLGHSTPSRYEQILF